MIDIESCKATLLLLRRIFTIKRFFQTLVYLWNYYFSDPIRLLVLGESGTGKTQFLNAILNNCPTTVSRTRLTQKKILKFENGKKIEFIDVPGHLTLYQVRKKEFNKIRKKKISGIINVVNYGYNESETAQDINIFKVGTNEVKDEYLNENRKREIKQLAEWKNEILPECGIKFIITIINKADIWYSQREEVNNYYEIGAYAQELSKLGNLAFHYFNYCSIIEPFYNRPMTISIGEQEKKRMHDSLTKEFLDILFKQL